MFKKLSTIVFLAQLLFYMGCVREDVSKCRNLRIKFSYTYNMQDTDLLENEVGDLRIYLFNEQGILVKVVRAVEADLKAGYVDTEMNPGRYTAVAWAGSGNDLFQFGYSDYEADDWSQQLFNNIVIGRTTKEDFAMMITYNTLTDQSLAEITPKQHPLGDLFYAMADHITVVQGENQTISFNLIKNTNTLKVKITGLEHLSGYSPSGRVFTKFALADLPLHVFVVGKNGQYRYDNTIGDYAKKVLYEPTFRSLSATDMEVDIKTLRFDKAYHTLDPINLYVRRPNSDKDLINPINVLTAILQIKNTQGNLLYRTQEDLDRQDEYAIEISILTNLSVRITINGFVIQDIIPEL